MKSKIQEFKECYICGRSENLHEHHIFYGTSNRKNSERTGLKVWLCYEHHNGSPAGVHFNKELDLYLKQTAQRVYEETTGTRVEFMAIFGRNYL